MKVENKQHTNEVLRNSMSNDSRSSASNEIIAWIKMQSSSKCKQILCTRSYPNIYCKIIMKKKIKISVVKFDIDEIEKQHIENRWMEMKGSPSQYRHSEMWTENNGNKYKESLVCLQ